MIVFENEGLVPIEAFSTFGINVKPKTETPIGFFGTGLKYAVAVTLRLGGTFKLLRGDDEYVFYLKKLDFRGTEFQQVRMKRTSLLSNRWSYHDLPFTTELGKHWEPWMAVRELESNCRDENGNSFVQDDRIPIYANQSDWTQIVIWCPEMEVAYIDDRDNNTIFMRNDAKFVRAINTFSAQGLQIFEGPSNYIYYRGLRVTDLPKPSLYTYNFTHSFDLTEDRTAKHPYYNNSVITGVIMQSNDHVMLDKILDTDEDTCFEGGLDFDRSYSAHSTSFEAAVGVRLHTGNPVPKRMKSFYQALHRDDHVEIKFAVMLTVGEIKELMRILQEANKETGDIHLACENTLEHESIPF